MNDSPKSSVDSVNKGRSMTISLASSQRNEGIFCFRLTKGIIMILTKLGDNRDGGDNDEHNGEDNGNYDDDNDK